MFMVALPPAAPPAPVVAGVQVSWPLSKHETVLSPGAKLTVRIVSKRRHAQVSFVRVNAAGKGLATVAKRTLRRGSFTATVPVATPGARYALRLTVAGRKRFSWVIDRRRGAPPLRRRRRPPRRLRRRPLRCSRSAGRRTRVRRIATSTPTVRLASATVEVGGHAVAFSVVNAGPGTFSVAGSASLVPDGQTSHYFGDFGEPWTHLRPGEEAQRSLIVHADTAPGSYRLAVPSRYTSCDVIASWPYLSEPFEVTAP